MINRKKDYPSLGIDIGGTKIASALDLNGALYEKIVLKTPAQASQEEILEALVAHINKYRGHHFREIGIGIPGLVDTAQGIVYNLANIPSFQEVNLKSYLENVFDVPVFINNDANCFVLAEHQHAAQYQHLVGITLGTGIGTGIIANSKLYGGHICGAGEWGAVSYLDKTYEEYCSGKFFLTKTGESSKRIYKNALSKEPLALDLFREYGQHLGNMINQIMFILAKRDHNIEQRCRWYLLTRTICLEHSRGNLSYTNTLKKSCLVLMISIRSILYNLLPGIPRVKILLCLLNQTNNSILTCLI